MKAAAAIAMSATMAMATTAGARAGRDGAERLENIARRSCNYASSEKHVPRDRRLRDSSPT